MSAEIVTPSPVALASPARRSITIAAVALGGFVVSLAQTLIVPALPYLPAALDTTADAVQWMLTATLLVGAVAVPVLTRLGDLAGKRRILLIALAAMVVGAVICGVSDDIAWQIAGRAVQGASSAVVPLGIALLAGILPADRSAGAVALISATTAIGGVVGLPMSALVIELLDFHALFWIIGAVALAAFIAIGVLVPEDASRAVGRLDGIGVVMLSAGLAALMLGMSQGSAWGWGSPSIVLLLVAAALLLVVFGAWQLRSTSPLVDIRQLRRRPVLFTNIAGLFTGFSLFAVTIGTISYLQAPEVTGYGFGLSMTEASLVMLPGGLGVVALVPLSAIAVRRIGAHRVLAVGAGVVALSWVLRILLTETFWEVFVAATISGIGIGISMAAMPALVNSLAPRDQLAAANGINGLLRTIGSSLASALGGSILAASVLVLGPVVVPTLEAFQLLFLVCAISSMVAMGAALLAGERVTRAEP